MPNDNGRRIRDLIRYICQHGWTAELARNGHWRVRGPQNQCLQLAYSPSDSRALLNMRSRLRRAGAPLPPR